jgi:transcriptional antiterminator NusG
MLHSEPVGVTHEAGAYLLAPPTGPLAGSHWFALRVRSQHDFLVRDRLEVQGIETFVPTWSEAVRWSDRTKTVDRPLFSGYVFARFSGDQASAVIRTGGVVQILPTSMDPIYISDAEIDNLKIYISDAEIDNLKLMLASRLPLAPCAYVAGQSVTIESGALAGVSGVVVRTKGSARLVVRVPMIMGAVNVELDADTVTKA